MHNSLRTKVALWFLFVIIVVGFAGYIGFGRLSDYILEQARTQMDAKLDHVIDVLGTTDSTYLKLVHSSMAVLRMLGREKGEPHLEWTANSSGSPEAVLYFGAAPVAGDDALVDKLKELMGGTAGIFVKQGDSFLRITTNLLRSDGSRAVGSVLDPNGAAFAAARQGESYFGVAEILGQPYITGYEPIRSSNGDTIGVFYVGFPLASLSEINAAMNEGSILSNGFFALLDHENRIIFRTENVRDPVEVETIVSAAEQHKAIDHRWLVKLRTFVPWDYDVIAALYLPDVSQETFAIIWQFYGIGSVILLGVLVVSFLLAARLSEALGDAEMSRREAVEARDAAQAANRTKSTFLANMSHELRTPMNAILGYSEMLIDEAEDLNVKELTSDLNKIRRAGKHLLSLINDILDLSKIEAGKMTLFVEEIDVASLVGDMATTMQPLIEKNSNRLEINVAPDCGRIRADLPKIRQTLLNLLGNATKFTAKGRITLSVRRIKRRISSDGVNSAADNSTERIQFSIKDTGIGMTPEQQGKLFQPFSQTDTSTTRKYGGTGLGLAISRRFCQLMGGDISVTSAAGHGSTFVVDLPVSMAETPSDGVLSARNEPPTD
jgi:signal transduction histidine kinase